MNQERRSRGHPPTEESGPGPLISADSHVIEPPSLWSENLPARLARLAPQVPEPDPADGFHPGGADPHARLSEMVEDDVVAEVLYPTWALQLFGLDDVELQQACFRVYNDWLIEYCDVWPDRLVGVPAVSPYDIDHARGEVERCHRAGLRGMLIWQAPPPDLPFTADHYEPLWDLAEELDAPVSIHILTGHGYSKERRTGLEVYRGSVTLKLGEVMNTLFEILFSGVLVRHPRLRFVLVENEIGWLPFVLQQWDYYFERFRESEPLPIDRPPSELFREHVWATFFNDEVGTRMLGWRDVGNFMWSNDFPHPNSTWPNSSKVIERDLAHLDAGRREKLLRANAAELYGLTVQEGVS